MDILQMRRAMVVDRCIPLALRPLRPLSAFGPLRLREFPPPKRLAQERPARRPINGGTPSARLTSSSLVPLEASSRDIIIIKNESPNGGSSHEAGHTSCRLRNTHRQKSGRTAPDAKKYAKP